MTLGELIVPWLVAFGLFNTLRNLEVWLHRHVFKVGWLTTKDYQTTTILYYTIFLPGVVLHEVTYWLAAGILNVRAENAIEWPEKQEIGELKLNFVQLSKKAGRLRRAIIATVPVLIGLAAVWYIANNIFDINTALATMSTGEMEDVGAGLRQLTDAPDFWLWVYIAFTISNAMLPNMRELAGWSTVLWTAAGVSAAFVVLGVGSEVVGTFLGGPVRIILNELSATFAVIIAIDLVAVAVLAAIENTIEWITGDSATFKNGKMITMTRAQMLEQRQKEIQKARQARAKRREKAPETSQTVYAFSLPIPGPPGEEPVTQAQKLLLPESKPRPALINPGKAGASVITTATDDEPTEPPRPAGLPAPPKPSKPEATPEPEEADG